MEAKTVREYYTLSGHKGGITSLAYRDDSKLLASASEDGTIKLWNMDGGTQAKPGAKESTRSTATVEVSAPGEQDEHDACSVATRSEHGGWIHLEREVAHPATPSVRGPPRPRKEKDFVPTPSPVLRWREWRACCRSVSS